MKKFLKIITKGNIVTTVALSNETDCVSDKETRVYNGSMADLYKELVPTSKKVVGLDEMSELKKAGVFDKILDGADIIEFSSEENEALVCKFIDSIKDPEGAKILFDY